MDLKKAGVIGLDEFTKAFKKSFELNVNEGFAGDMGIPLTKIYRRI